MALLAQVCAMLSATLIAAATPAMTLWHAPSLLQWALMQGVIAAAIGQRLGLEVWWLPVQFAFTPALVATLSLELQPLWYLGGFLLLTMVYGKIYRTGVPLYLSSRSAVKALATLLPAHRGFSFIDLGSGCGGLLHELHAARPDGYYCGIEAAPLPLLLSKCRNFLAADGCSITWGDFWTFDLSPYDVAYAYLSPLPMAALWQKARRELRPGSLFVSNSFAIPGVPPQHSIELGDFGGSVLHIWRI
jgi:hypothetical protein